MKNLENLTGIKILSKKDQVRVTGGEVPMSCADMGLQYMTYERCIRVAPPNCRDWCSRM